MDQFGTNNQVNEDLLQHENHQVNTLAVEEKLLVFGLTKCGAQCVEDILHELSLVGVHRISSPKLLTSEKSVRAAFPPNTSTYREDFQHDLYTVLFPKGQSVVSVILEENR